MARDTSFDIDPKNPTIALEYEGKMYSLDKYDALMDAGATVQTIFYVLKDRTRVSPGKIGGSPSDLKFDDESDIVLF
jgi:hypothetical protein